MTTETTRRHPRTLAEAWPREHANPIAFYPEPLARRAARIAFGLVCAALLGWLAAQGV